MEIRSGDIVNLGICLPETVAAAAVETGRLREFTLTVESGPIGCVPATGLSFGCSHYPEAIVDQPSQFDFYDGGGLDVAVLGAFEVDAEGSVNVSAFAGRFAGVGGFVNIAQSARRVVFCCAFRAARVSLAARCASCGREAGEVRPAGSTGATGRWRGGASRSCTSPSGGVRTTAWLRWSNSRRAPTQKDILQQMARAPDPARPSRTCFRTPA